MGLWAQSAFPSTLFTSGTWKGDGALFDRDGKWLSNYSFEVINTQLSPNEFKSEVTVHLPDGKVLQVSQTMTKTGENSFGIVSTQGNGGGYCFGEGLCQLYISMGNGHGIAITNVSDGDDKMRCMKTELKDGEAIHFFRDKMERVN